jgi:hypothetical protein
MIHQQNSTTLLAGGDAIALAECLPDHIGERRTTTRSAVSLHACLVPLNGAAAIRCDTDDLGEDGMHVTVPLGYGVAIGQRYELQLAAPGASVGMGPLITGAGCYATVVRTRIHVGPGGDRVGVGLLFDQPLALAGVC